MLTKTVLQIKRARWRRARTEPVSLPHVAPPAAAPGAAELQPTDESFVVEQPEERSPMQQVLMYRTGSSTPRFELRENPSNQSPGSFEDAQAGARVPRLGTQDLLAIARYATANGFTLNGFVIEDQALTRVPEELEQEISEELIPVLIRDGVAHAAAIIDDEYGYYVTGVKLTGHDRRPFTLLREGVTRTQPETHLEDFLQAAWTAVHFS
ncbi:hypothetical protein [Curtobacterium citreum]|uniref:hypothetical protein n=1 Tax=Curtobacterium citreum TaxID=2036 RepID=UPI002543C6D2|nr:hypothetical protein [Curtobacterium citreum]WIJ45575.1 hypothetical protein QPK07_01045 [Curtobacterium citreum]